MNSALTQLTSKKEALARIQPLPPELVNNLDEWFKVELTYSSNAIEGNTLTRQETALVVEKGLTVAGKSVVEHLEARNLAQAIEYTRPLLKTTRQDITEVDLLDMHQCILQGIDDVNAGRYRSVSVRIAGSNVIMPNPVKVPEFMGEFIEWLHQSTITHPATFAADAHYKLVSIHPFVDGNGRTARLLMNILLGQAGYPPALIRPEDRQRYIRAIEQAQLGGSLDDYYTVIYEGIERSFDVYLEALGAPPQQRIHAISEPTQLLKIGELAKATGELPHTLRYWTQQGLLPVAGTTSSGYFLYAPSATEQVRFIRQLQQEQRLTIDEIRPRLQTRKVA